MIDEGYYKGCEFVSAEVTETKTGTDQMQLDFKIESGQTVRVYLFLSDAAWPYTEEKLQRMGFNGDFDAPEFSDANDVELQCRQEEYDGKWREKWDIAGGGTAKAAGSDKKKRYAAKWKQGNRAPAAKAPPAKKGPPPAKGSTDKVTTKDGAWAVWEEVRGDFDVELWHKAVASVGDENDLTADDWNKIAEMASIPF